jgi:hypothetical protein
VVEPVGDIAQGLDPSVMNLVQPHRQPFFDAVKIIRKSFNIRL